MSTLLRHAVLLALSAWVSWWVVLRVPAAAAGPEAREPATVLTVVPLLHDPVRAETAEAAPSREAPPPAPRVTVSATREADAEAAPEPAPAERAPPALEIGAPEGEEELAGRALAPTELETTAAELPPDTDPPETDPTTLAADRTALAAGAAEPAPDESVSEVEARMRDPALLATAKEELARGDRKGFATVLLSTPEDQLAIARFFGEELVLVPRAALDPENAAPSYFRLAGSLAVERVEGAPPLGDRRQYRDLFDYEYGRLPAPLRELRRSLVARDGVYLFAALLSDEEWALVIARRGEALARAGRELADVRRFVLRYVPLAGGAYDLRADEIVFTDGTRFVPASREEG